MMLKKKGYLFTILVYGIISLCACGKMEEIVEDIDPDAIIQDIEDSIEENSYLSGRYVIGETAELKTIEEDNKETTIEVTFTEWGSFYDELFGLITYMKYEIKNTGSNTATVGNGMFNVYSDNYLIEQLAFGDDVISNVNLSSGRQINGTVYVGLEPDSVSTIEIECGDVIWVIKEPTSIIDVDEIPADITRDEEEIAYENMSGGYTAVSGASASLSMYSSIEDEYVGNIDIQGDIAISGQLVPIDTNIYQITTSDQSVVLISMYTMNENVAFELYIDGQLVDDYIMVELYIS